jgi:glycerophosphoryl diester phosphodiesterase
VHVQIYGHRGAPQIFPENTLEAFAEAVRLGVDGIELDIHATSDGTPVIIHDSSLSRTAESSSLIADLSLTELRGIAPTVPTFAEVLQLVGSAVHLDVEVKQPGAEQSVLDVLAQYPDVRWSISCFDWSVLEQFRALDPECDLWLLGYLLNDELLGTARRLGATAAAIIAPAITEDTIIQAHDAGLRVMAWTVNEIERARQLSEWGLDMLCSDAPQLFVG